MKNALKSQLYIRSRDKAFLVFLLCGTAFLTAALILTSPTLLALQAEDFRLTGVVQQPNYYACYILNELLSNFSFHPWLYAILAIYLFAYETEHRHFSMAQFSGNSRLKVCLSCFLVYYAAALFMALVPICIAEAVLAPIGTSAIIGERIKGLAIRLMLDWSLSSIYLCLAMCFQSVFPALAVSMSYTYAVEMNQKIRDVLTSFYPSKLDWLPVSDFYTEWHFHLPNGAVLSVLLGCICVLISLLLFQKRNYR